MTHEPSMLIDIGIKSLVLGAITLLLLKIASRRLPAERSLIAHIGLLAIMALPLAIILLPEWAPLPKTLVSPAASAERPSGTASLPVPLSPLILADTETDPPGAASDVDSGMSGTTPRGSSLDTQTLLFGAYAIPFAVFAGIMLIAVARLFRMRARAAVVVEPAWLSALAQAQRRMGFKHGTALLVSAELRSPISWGIVRPTIVLDPRAARAVNDAEAIIAHELAHIARLDWAKLLLARIACAVFWFNPFVWLLARESHQLREETADDTVLMTNIAGSDYATLLVSAARHDNRGVLIAAHGVAPAKSSLRRRVERVLDGSVERGAVTGRWTVASAALFIALAAPLAAFSPIGTEAETASEGSINSDASWVPSLDAEDVAGRSDPDFLAAADVSVNDADTTASPADAEGIERSVRVDADDVIAAKATGMTPDYAAEMRSVVGDVAFDELIGARAVGVDADYVRAMRVIDRHAELDEITGARAVGVTPDYARQMRAYFN